MSTESEPLIPPHGGYRKLKSFQIARLIYDLTVRFCDHYIDRRSRTTDQMIQAARSGVQNIAEGSQVSGTSKKSELRLTNVARASLEELRLDYEDFLRQHGLKSWPPEHPAMQRFKAKRCASLIAIRDWITSEHQQEHTVIAPVAAQRPTTAELGANAALSLLNLCCYLLDRQLAAQAASFEESGGFTERLYRMRSAKRR